MGDQPHASQRPRPWRLRIMVKTSTYNLVEHDDEFSPNLKNLEGLIRALRRVDELVRLLEIRIDALEHTAAFVGRFLDVVDDLIKEERLDER